MKLIEIPKNELRDLYEKKEFTTYEIADIYNCCQATIWKRLHHFNIKTRFPWNAVDLPKKKLHNLYIKKKLSTWEIEKKYRIPRSTVHRKLLEYGINRRNLAESHIIYTRKNFDGNKADKAYLIGFAVGDLRVRKRGPNSETVNIDCGSTKQEQIDLIVKLFKPYGRVWISKPNRKGATHVECLLNESFNFLLEKRILIDPHIINNKDYFWAFLAGFTDAEGCISISQDRAYYSLGNYNKKLLAQIRRYLLENEINCSQLIESKIKGKICFDKYFHQQNYWHFQIHSKDSLLTLFRFISPYIKHSKKREDIKKAQQNIRLRNRIFITRTVTK